MQQNIWNIYNNEFICVALITFARCKHFLRGLEGMCRRKICCLCTEDEANEADFRQNKGCQVSPFTGYEP